MNNGIDSITCRECGKAVKAIAHFHLRKCCGLSVKEYQMKYPDAPIRAKCVNQKVSDAYKDPNSGFNTPKHRELRRQRALENWSKGGRWRTEENRRRRSQAVSKAMNDPNSYFQSEDARKKRSQTLRRRWKNPNDGIGSDSANDGRSKSMKSLWEQGKLCESVFQSPTSIEIEIMKVLDKYRIKHQSQWSPNGYSRVYDEYIFPDILVEIHGSYWHSLREDQERDLEKARWAHQNGYKFITIWDFQLKQYGADLLVKNWIVPLNSKMIAQGKGI